MMLKYAFLLLLSFVITVNCSFAFVNCQPKYDNHPRALSKFKGSCGVCHINPSGSGPQNEFGKAFKGAGFKITDELVSQFPELFKQEKEGETSSNDINGSGTKAAPVIKRTRPKKSFVNVQSMLKIKGENFIEGVKAFINENEAVTNFRSSMLLIVDVLFDSLGVNELKVKNPDGQESNTITIEVKEKK